MAKKKTETAAGSAAPKKTTRKAGPAKSAKPQSAALPAEVPMIDTSLAAQSAARMLVNRDRLQGETAGNQPQRDSAAFKHLKETAAKPQLTNPLLTGGGGKDQKKSGAHFILNKQTGHNQTLGHFNKTGVPRRTPG